MFDIFGLHQNFHRRPLPLSLHNPPATQTTATADVQTSKSKRTISKGLASYCQAKTTLTFHFYILTLSNAFLSIKDREMKSESGFSLVMASQPFVNAILIS